MLERRCQPFGSLDTVGFFLTVHDLEICGTDEFRIRLENLTEDETRIVSNYFTHGIDIPGFWWFKLGNHAFSRQILAGICAYRTNVLPLITQFSDIVSANLQALYVSFVYAESGIFETIAKNERDLSLIPSDLAPGNVSDEDDNSRFLNTHMEYFLHD